ncbi:MAG: DEAD/DEAH box helicase family protein, partial [Prevotella sp.]|nr:DEAD/DEAH box helicase family protein [Prevotella sp.]
MAKTQRIQNTVPQTLSNTLVLNRFILNLFGADSLQSLSENLKDPASEGYTEEGVSIFAELLKARLYIRHEITEEMLLEYDHNISKYTQEINRKRDHKIKWKYFQYLSLLFTEIYLDKYFTNKDKLLEDIRNYHTSVFNQDPSTNHEITEFTEKDLNKLAFWSATGSGKTLLMHANILQFQHYLSHAKKKVNKTILITPNEGLTNQHIVEFQQSNIDGHPFNKFQASGMFGGEGIDIIEITKLAETDG